MIRRGTWQETNQKQDEATDKCKQGVINVNIYNRREKQNEASSKADKISAFMCSKVPCKREKRTNEDSKVGTKIGVPKGFVTRRDMEERLKNRKGYVETNVKTGKNIGQPKGVVTRTETEKSITKTSSIKEEPKQWHSKSLSESATYIKSKDKPRVKADSLGLGMKSSMKTGFQNKKTKSTQKTPTYSYELSPGHISPEKHIHVYQENCYTGKDNGKADQTFKNLLSRLCVCLLHGWQVASAIFVWLWSCIFIENKTHGKTGLQSDIHSTNSRLPNITHIKGKTDKEIEDTTNSLKGDRKSNDEFFASRNKLEDYAESRRTAGLDTNTPERTQKASTTISNYSVVPRKSCAAIVKPAGYSNACSSDKPDHVKILIMNANGNSKSDCGGSSTEKRKHAIHEVVWKHMPNIVLFQEFSWVGITGKAWTNYPFPEQFVYKGHYDASIMYDNKCMKVQNLPAADIDRILTGLQRNANSRIHRTFPMDFNPVARMCTAKITAFAKPGLEFICISWHGKSNEVGGGKMKTSKKIEYFQYWMEFLKNIREKYTLPILAAGDYNIDMYSIEHCVSHPFRLCLYEASKRRTVRGIVDFCIVTDDIEFSDISCVNLETDTSVFSPNSILDHDPIVGSLTANMPGSSVNGVRPTPISKYNN